MKLLLDENLPHQLRHEIPGHECFTVIYMGWSGVENGELLAKAAAHGFDALLTMDGNLSYQQNVANLPAAVVVLQSTSNAIVDLRPLFPALLTTLNSLAPRSVNVVS